MTTYFRSGHFRMSASGTEHWVEGHWVTRYGGGGHSSFSTAGRSWASGRGDGEIRPSRCPVCGATVYFYSNDFGSRVFFDDPGSPWPKHPCTTANQRRTSPAPTSTTTSLSAPARPITFVSERPGFQASKLRTSAPATPDPARVRKAVEALPPDQYAAVTVGLDQCQIIDGGPGTGKTFVAAHRVAHLAVELHETGAKGNIVLIGPTQTYVEYVRALLDELLDGRASRVHVVALPSTLASLTGLKGPSKGPSSTSYQDAGSELALIVGRLIAHLERAGALARTAEPIHETVYEWLRNGRVPVTSLTSDADWATYLRTLPPIATIRSRRAHQPLLALIAWYAKGQVPPWDAAHVVVDEAQDVLPLEWALLDALNTSGLWTLLGDVDQRRSDHAYRSWDQVADQVFPTDGQPPIQYLDASIRTTGPILAFASRLLRSRRRAASQPRGGDEPVVTKAPTGGLNRTVLGELSRLHKRDVGGLTAIIAIDTDGLHRELRASNWAPDAGTGTSLWHKGPQSVAVLTMDDARGLEFDAVIVVEPAAFPVNVGGHHGPLFTALTRASRDLVVVHESPLPEELQRR